MTGTLVYTLILPLVVGYLLGSIPFGLLIARIGGAGDVRKIGSGNIGATNVLRTGRKELAALTLLCDALKGAAAVWLCQNISPDAGVVAGLGAFLGHLFPVWLKFKGGKGIAVYVGVLLAISWKVLVVFAFMWLGIAAVFRYSSLAALVATVACPVAFWWLDTPPPITAWVFALMTGLAWIMHRENISRLVAGREGKIGEKG